MLLHFGESIRKAISHAGPPDTEGWITTVLPYESFNDARKNILNLGRALEVLEPEPLRLSIIDFARQIVDFYSA